MTTTTAADLDLVDLWDRAGRGDRDAWTVLVEHYIWLPRQLAATKRVPPHFDRDDLMSWAMGGLFDAVTKFKPSENRDGKLHEHFIGYAKRRISGAILDGMKAPGQSWAPRGVWRDLKAMNVAEDDLAQSLGRPPTRLEVAAHMNVPVADLPYLQQTVHMDGPRGAETDVDPGLDVLPDADLVDLTVEVGDAMDRLASKISQLRAPEQHLLEMFYLEGMDVAAVADALRVSPTIVKRRKAAALTSLRALLQRA